MDVMVTGRRAGKTGALIEWLLNGHSTEKYPYWSRVIICAHQDQVVSVINRVNRAIAYMGDVREAYEIRKAIWSANELISQHKDRGLGHLEFAIDDADLFIQHIISPYHNVSLMAFTGNLVQPQE